ncbi:hypothetical protein AB0K43_24055 [Kitasatospora sp. NPDC049258]|uniref:hypothetical protein n=1 Tax=Kitasatospora sp. NPDC049258 TaxID=3155394 RepID=UPI00343B6FE8
MPDPRPRDTACHELLLALAGRLPDAPLRSARLALADGGVHAATTLALAELAGQGRPVTAAELAAAGALLAQELAPDDFLTVGRVPDPPYDFTEFGDAAELAADLLDEAVLLTAEACADQVTGVWRCWRRALFADEPDRRVYLVQAEYPDDAPVLAGTFHEALAAVGDEQAGVEVVAIGSEVVGYQRLVLDHSLLLWAAVATDGPEFEVARVFDHVDPDLGPGFRPDHPILPEGADRDHVLAHLSAGRPVLSTTARMADPLDPAAGEAVPGGFLTDGHWIWTEAVGYFLDRHGLAPDPALLAHIRTTATHPTPPPDDATVTRAVDFLLHRP